MSVRAMPQASLYEQTVENAELEEALEAREKAKEKSGAARKVYREAHDKAKALVETVELADETPVRVGRFVLTRKTVPARAVNFETEESSRLAISLIPDQA